LTRIFFVSHRFIFPNPPQDRHQDHVLEHTPFPHALSQKPFPLQSQLLQHPARRRIPHHVMRVYAVQRQLQETVIDYRPAGFRCKTFAPALNQIQNLSSAWQCSVSISRNPIAPINWFSARVVMPNAISRVEFCGPAWVEIFACACSAEYGCGTEMVVGAISRRLAGRATTSASSGLKGRSTNRSVSSFTTTTRS